MIEKEKRFFKINVYEQLRKTVEIEATSAEEALQKAELAYTNGEITLGDRDYDGPRFEIDHDCT